MELEEIMDELGDGGPDELASTETQQKRSNGTDDGWEEPEGPIVSGAVSRSTERTSEQAEVLDTELAWEDGSEDELA